MIARASSVVALGFGFALGSLLSPGLSASHLFAPTPITWKAESCPAGRATVTTTATDPNGNTYSIVTPDVLLPAPSVDQIFPNLPPTSYTVRASVRYDDGSTVASDTQHVTGLGDAPVPVPSPSATPSPSPLPSPVPTPSPAPSSTPIPQQPSPNCTRGAVVTDSKGAVWTFGANQVTVRSGVDVNGKGSVYLFSGGVVYTFGIDNRWYRWDDAAALWIFVSLTEPACGTPIPTPGPAPTVDLTPVTAAIASQTIAIQASLQTSLAAAVQSILTASAPATIPCTVTAVGSYANGDQKLTVRCPPSGLATNQPLKIVK